MESHGTTPVTRRGMRRLRVAIAAALCAALATACGEPVELVALSIIGGDIRAPVGWGGEAWPFAIYSDGFTEFVGAETDWVSSNTSVATVEDIGAQGARVSALAPGEAVITATYRDMSDSVTITIPDTW